MNSADSFLLPLSKNPVADTTRMDSPISLRDQIHQWENEIKTLQSSIRFAEMSMRDDEKELNKLKMEMETMKEEADKLEMEMETMKEEADKLEMKMETMKEEADKLEMKMETMKQELKDAKEEADKLKMKMETTGDDIQSTERIKEKDDLHCERTVYDLYLDRLKKGYERIDDHQKRIDDHKKRIDDHKKRIDDHKKRIDDHQKRIDNYQKWIDELESKIKSSTLNLTQLKNDKRSLLDKICSAQSQISQLEKPPSNMQWIKDIDLKVPSDFAGNISEWIGFQRKHLNWTRDYRPCFNRPFPVQLAFPLFGKFIHDCSQIMEGKISDLGIPIAEYEHYYEFQLKMSEYYLNELAKSSKQPEGRQEALIKVWNEFFDVKLVRANPDSRNISFDFHIKFQHDWKRGLIEVKNDGKVDEAFRRLITYLGKYVHLQLIAQPCDAVQRSPFPMIAVSVTGSILSVYLVTLSTSINVEPGFSINLAYPNRNGFYLFRRLNQLLRDFDEWYDLSCTATNDRSLFDVPFNLQPGRVHQFQKILKESPTAHVYQAVAETRERVIIKYTRHYCVAAHEFCAENDIAPYIISCTDLQTGFYEVIMDHLNSHRELTQSDASNASLILAVENGLKMMHDAGYVHGDFRYQNILIKEMGPDEYDVKFIDFDWSGHVKEPHVKEPHVKEPHVKEPHVARYPVPVSNAVLWHEDVGQDFPLDKKHDLHFLELIKKGESMNVPSARMKRKRDSSGTIDTAGFTAPTS